MTVETEMVATTEEMAMWTARLAAATSTQNESKQRCWLEIVSICARAEETERETHLGRPGHPSDIQTVRTDSLGVNVGAEDSKSKLKTSAKRKTAKRLTGCMPAQRNYAETL